MVILTHLRIALALLTRLDPRWLGWQAAGNASPPANPANLVQSAWAFPLIGGLVGGGAAAIWYLANWVALPVGVAAGLAVLAGVILTGGLHEDGLADTADGMFGPMQRSIPQRLAIMRDPHLGSFAVIALGFSLMLRVACLASQSLSAGIISLITAHIVSRAAMTGCFILPLARKDGMAAGFMAADSPESNPSSRRRGWPSILAAMMLGLGLILALYVWGYYPGGQLLVLIAAVAGAMLALAGLARRRLGGATGDIYGAAQQLGEITVMILLSIPAAMWTCAS